MPLPLCFAGVIAYWAKTGYNNTNPFLCKQAFLGFGRTTSAPEEQAQRPDAGQAYQRIDQTADGSQLPAKDGGHQVEAEKADQPPVQRADDDQSQDNFIPAGHSRHGWSLLFS